MNLESKNNLKHKELIKSLMASMNQNGFWTGELSSSALGVAVSVAALHFYDEKKYEKNIAKGFEWLLKNKNDDGGFGDSPESPGNVSTSLLVYASCNLYVEKNQKIAKLQPQIAQYLFKQGIDVNNENIVKSILDYYKKDYTFSVPILTLCALCGVSGVGGFKKIPQLPFELALMPRRFYSLLNLNVVSYAIPALIAVGILVFKKKNKKGILPIIRKSKINKAIKLLEGLVPESGGFLEAIPLTAFVSLSLVEAGFKQSKTVEKGIDFLVKAQREDGSWPIDVDLSIWVTTLAIKAIGKNNDDVLNKQQKKTLTDQLIKFQNKESHSFNGSQPGGWGWTNLPGAVPDGDDTPGAILALLNIGDKASVKDAVIEGCRWITKIQNRNGGIPTFSKGWGKLPFDESCTDLTGHCLLALSTTIETYGAEMDKGLLRNLKGSINAMLYFLMLNQFKDGRWLPLWFGNQMTENHKNPVYGTARILTYLNETVQHTWLKEKTTRVLYKMITTGMDYLQSAQNTDGSWGGARDITGSIEETALSISALSGGDYNNEVEKGLQWLDKFHKENGMKPAPIGLYFASLWYSEKMYPLVYYIEALYRVKKE